MANVVIVGMQWGDEGKGKIVDLLCPAFDVVVRYQGGHNAGHTVRFGDRHFSLHLIPSGILHPGMRCVLGNGMVVAPGRLARRARPRSRRPASASTAGSSSRTAPTSSCRSMPSSTRRARRRAGGARSAPRRAASARPTRARSARTGLRIGRPGCAPDLEDRLRVAADRGSSSSSTPSAASRCRRPRRLADLLPRLGGAPRAAPRGHRAAPERLDRRGARASSSRGRRGRCSTSTTAPTPSSPARTRRRAAPRPAPACRRPAIARRASGVLKAYTTRVGGGPFPTELHDATGRAPAQARQRVRHRHRPPAPLRLARHRRRRATAARVNGIDAIALTKLDVLDDLDEIPVCVAYRKGGGSSATCPQAAPTSKTPSRCSA